MDEDDMRDSHLPVSADHLRETLCGLVNPQAADEWRAMMAGLRVVVNTFYDGLAAKIRTDVEEQQPSTARTCDMLADLVKLAGSAQFTPLSMEMWGSIEGEFTFQFPVDVTWAAFEGRYLKSYFDVCHAGQYFGTPSGPDFADKILILTKGRGTVSQEGRFVEDKLNLLLAVIWRKIKRTIGIISTPAPCIAPPADRNLLTDICRQHGILNVLMAHNTIRTSTFEDVVLVYFPKADGDAAAKTTAAKEKVGEAMAKGGGEKRRMVIESYEKVPWEDLEAILPYKEVRLKPVHFFEMLIYSAMIAAALYYMVVAYINGEEGESNGELLVFLQIVIISIGKQIYDLSFYYGTLKVAHKKAVQDYQSTLQTGKGLAVVAKLVDDVKAQEFKEMALAYFCCWTRGPSTAQEVDELAESILLQEFGLQLNFDVEDALEKLEKADLVRADRKGRYVITMRPADWTAKYPTAHITSMQIK